MTGEILEEEKPKKITWITEKINRYRSSKVVILEVEPHIRHLLIKKGKIRVGLQICRVEDSNMPTQCRKCFQFTHRTGQCTLPVHCSHCGKPGHVRTECIYGDRPPNCRNCTNKNPKTDIAHTRMDRKCPSFKISSRGLGKDHNPIP